MQQVVTEREAVPMRRSKSHYSLEGSSLDLLGAILDDDIESEIELGQAGLSHSVIKDLVAHGYIELLGRAHVVLVCTLGDIAAQLYG